MRTCATDADAHGLDIIRTYKLGSANMAYAAEQLKLPTIRWLGVRQSDLTSFGVSSRCLLPLTTNDKRMAQRLLSAPDKLAQVHPAAHAELTAMVKSGTKAEIECLHTVPGGLVKYLQTKLAAALKTTDDDEVSRTCAARAASALLSPLLPLQQDSNMKMAPAASTVRHDPTTSTSTPLGLVQRPRWEKHMVVNQDAETTDGEQDSDFSEEDSHELNTAFATDSASDGDGDNTEKQQWQQWHYKFVQIRWKVMGSYLCWKDRKRSGEKKLETVLKIHQQKSATVLLL